MTITSSFMCLLILLLVCLSFGYTLHGDQNEESSVNVVSNAKVMKHVNAIKKLQVRDIREEDFSKETTNMMLNSKKPTNKDITSNDEDLVAYTADYWKPRHHPPKNN
ncbi:unnamed protein product [Cochlearia groenlandica]